MLGSVNGKRKREAAIKDPTPNKKIAVQTLKKIGTISTGVQNGEQAHDNEPALTPASLSSRTEKVVLGKPFEVQIIVGSYERVLHGIRATIAASALNPSHTLDDRSASDQTPLELVTFADTFLFTAHTAAIRCLAISPSTESDKCLLATGSSDERINVYSLSTASLPAGVKRTLPSVNGVETAENPLNRSLGSLNHHARAITRLYFPTKSKLFSAAEDATICISRTRDWTVLSSIKSPIPKAHGRPSGDTAGPGEVPAGVNDFAIHPSQKLMLSVGRGERCMRLWNLMTGKKAGVLNFDRALLARVGEGKYSSGEGRRVLWDVSLEHYVVGFERGAIIFGVDSKPKALIRTAAQSKIHQMRFFPSLGSEALNVLVVSTEDGRILFYNVGTVAQREEAADVLDCACIGQLGGQLHGVNGRIKDFDILTLPGSTPNAAQPRLLVTCGSDGTVQLWTVSAQDLGVNNTLETSTNGTPEQGGDRETLPRQVGQMIGSLNTGNRITCLGAFWMTAESTEHGAVE